MENDLFQADRVEQLTPLLLRTLERANLNHHHDTHARSGKITLSIRDDILIDNEAGIARFHSFDDIGEDMTGLLIGPVVKDPVQIICSSTYEIGRPSACLIAALICGAWLRLPFTGCGVKKS